MKNISTKVKATVVAVICIGLAIVYNGHKIAEKNNARKPEPTQISAPDVSVILALPGKYQAYVKSHGEAKAHWALALKSQVTGKVTSLSQAFETGKIISEGDILANIDNTEYLQAVASAKSSLAEALLALQEEKDLSVQAKREWERSGVTKEPTSPLAFRTLQLEAAQALANEAEHRLQTAIRDEKNTYIRAPFNAVVLSRDIALGSYVVAGEIIANINSSDKVEVYVPLTLSQFQNINPDLSGEVTLTGVTTDLRWQGYIDRVENHLETSSRQRNIVIAVDAPFKQVKPLIAGSFVEVEIAGKVLNGVLKIPASAVSQNGQVWYVDVNNTLVSVIANKIFERGKFVYISPLEGVENPNIVIRPLVSYLNGMVVNPVDVALNAALNEE
jgi:membrane fusion protein, multidrug efflux system